MFRVRHYDQMIHPDHFRGSGFLGWAIVCLNWTRWRLEVFVQRLVVRWLAKNGALPKGRVKELLKAFDVDAAAERLQKEQTSPTLHHEVEESYEQVVATRAMRYAEGTPKTITAATDQQNGLPVRGQPLNELIGKFAFPIRAKKYSRGHRFHVANPDGDFEPMSPEESKKS